MRKLTLLTCLLMGAFCQLMANATTGGSITFSVEAETYPTDFGNNFAYYHVNLDLDDLTQVAKNGLLKIAVDYQSGMEIKETRFEKKSNGAMYYVTDLTTPMYNATVTDPSGNILLQKSYGGFDKSIDYGRERSMSESDLAAKWLNEKDQYLQRLEFQNLDFTDLEADLIEVLETSPIVVPIKEKAQPRKPKKVRLPAPVEEEEVTAKIESAESKEMMEEKKGEPINEAAAVTEEEILKDPFGELSEPLIAEDNEPAPAAPVDYEESAQLENRKAAKKDRTMKEEQVESLTPALSDRRNLVKLNLSNLALGNLTLNYERLLSARNSVSVHLGYIRPQKPFSLLNDALDVDETVEPGEFSGLTATVEYRIYSKKKGAGRGFYIAPYARYANHKLAFNTTIEDNFTNADTQLSAVGLGGQIGAQWLIKDRIVIDWGILGLAAQWYNFKSTFRSIDAAIDFDEIRADLEMEIEDIPGLSNKLEFSNDETSLSAKMPFLFGGARAYLSVGYKF